MVGYPAIGLALDIHRHLTSQPTTIFIPPAMPSLATMPNEVLADICSYLDTPDLAAISLASALFHAIALPYLYTSADLSNPLLRNDIQRFLLTMISHPVLTTHVRSMFVEMGREIWDATLPGESDIVTRFAAAAASFDLQESMIDEGTHLLLLLYLLPQLHRLEIGVNWDNDAFKMFLFQRALDPGGTLPARLKSVREIEYRDCRRCPWNNSLWALFTLPAIRSIHLHVRGGAPSEGAPWAYPGQSTVTRLTVQDCRLLPESLVHILTFPRALTRFTYMGHVGPFGALECAGFGRALVAVRETLQYLCFLVTAGRAGYFPPGVEATLGSLQNWPMLRIVKCPLVLLLEANSELPDRRLVDVLPLVLTELTIGRDWYWVPVRVAMSLSDFLGCTHVLERLTVVMDLDEGSLPNACAASGVQLDVLIPEQRKWVQ